MADATLAQLRALEKRCAAGYADEVLERSLETLLAHQRTQLQTHPQELKQDLREFEARSGISSAAFLTRYQTGELGDSAEVIEWRALYRMYAQLQQQVALLQELDGGLDHHGLSRRGESKVEQ